MNNNTYMEEFNHSFLKEFNNDMIGNYSPMIPSTPRNNNKRNINTLRLNSNGKIIKMENNKSNIINLNNNGNRINNKIATNIVEYYSAQPVKNQKKTKRIEFLDIIKKLITNDEKEIREKLKNEYGNNSNIYRGYLKIINKIKKNEANRNEVANYVYGVTNFLEEKEEEENKKKKKRKKE